MGAQIIFLRQMQTFFLFDDFAVFKQQHPLGVAGSLTIMRNHDYRGTLRQIEVCKQLDYFLLVLAVQVSCRFIGKDECRIIC